MRGRLLALALTTLLAVPVAAAEVSIFELTPLGEGRSSHRAVVAAGHLFVAGGRTEATRTCGGWTTCAVASVVSAPLRVDGSLGPWRSAGSLPDARAAMGLVAWNDWVYLVGGHRFDGMAEGRAEVWRARAQADGTLAGWEGQPSLPTHVFNGAVVVAGDVIYLTGGSTGWSARRDVFWTRIQADGRLGAWQTGPALPEQRESHAALVAGGHLYLFGGDGHDAGGGVRTGILRAALQPGGGLGPWTSAGTWPEARGHMAWAQVGGTLAMAAGHDQAAFRADAWVAKVVGDAVQLTRVASVDPRIAPAGATDGGQLFVVAGDTPGGAYTRSVYALPVIGFDLIEAVRGLQQEIAAGFARVLAAIDDLSGQVEAGFAGLSQDLARGFGALGARFDEAERTEPLEVTITSPPGLAGSRGPFYVTVALRGELVAADLVVLLDGAPAPAVQTTPLDAPGLYLVAPDPDGRDAGSHAFTVLASKERHRGAATTWFGLGVLPPGAEEEASDLVDDLTKAPAPGPMTEVRLLDVRQGLPGQSAETPGIEREVASLQGAPDEGGDYVLQWDIAGRASGALALPQAGLVPPVALSLVRLPPVGAQTPEVGVELLVSYRYDAAAPRCVLATGDGCVTLPAPPSPGWLGGPGVTAVLHLEARLVDGDGNVLVERSVDVPLAGQVLGWAMPVVPA